MKALTPAVIGVMAVSLVQFGPAALSDAFAMVVFVLAVFRLARLASWRAEAAGAWGESGLCAEAFAL